MSVGDRRRWSQSERFPISRQNSEEHRIMRSFLPLTLVLALATGGCHFSCDWTPGVSGSGVLVTEARAVESFRSLSLSGGMELYIRVGLEEKVVIHADDNLQPLITTRVEGGELRIRFEESMNSDHTLRAEIDLPELSGIDISGSSHLTVIGVEGEELRIDIAGSCRGEVSGWVDRLEVDIAGSCRLDLLELEARSVEIDIAGSGKVETHATEELDISISGSGSVNYRGQPRLNLQQSGSARVRPL
jgi:hypothetical protein